MSPRRSGEQDHPLLRTSGLKKLVGLGREGGIRLSLSLGDCAEIHLSELSVELDPAEGGVGSSTSLRMSPVLGRGRAKVLWGA